MRAYELSPESLKLLSQYEDEYFHHLQYPDSKMFTATVQGTASVRISRGKLVDEDPAYSKLQGWTLDDAEVVDIRVN